MDPLTGSLLAAGVSSALPFVSKALGSAFGLDEASDAEKAAIGELNRVARGGTTQAQAGAAYARGKTLADLQAMASKGTAQQQAGAQRAAMQAAPEAMAQQAAQLADLRSREQERARALAAQYESMRAARELQSKQRMMAGAVGGAGQILAQQLMLPGKEAAPVDELAALTKEAPGIGQTEGDPAGLSSSQAAGALGFAQAPAAAPAGPSIASVMKGAPAPGTAQPGYESLYKGPSIETGPLAAQQKTEQDAAMTYLGMTNPGQYTDLAKTYFAPAAPVDTSAGFRMDVPQRSVTAPAHTPVAPDMKGSVLAPTTASLGIRGDVAEGAKMIPDLWSTSRHLTDLEGMTGRPQRRRVGSR